MNVSLKYWRDKGVSDSVSHARIFYIYFTPSFFPLFLMFGDSETAISEVCYFFSIVVQSALVVALRTRIKSQYAVWSRLWRPVYRCKRGLACFRAFSPNPIPLHLCPIIIIMPMFIYYVKFFSGSNMPLRLAYWWVVLLVDLVPGKMVQVVLQGSSTKVSNSITLELEIVKDKDIKKCNKEQALAAGNVQFDERILKKLDRKLIWHQLDSSLHYACFLRVLFCQQV